MSSEPLFENPRVGQLAWLPGRTARSRYAIGRVLVALAVALSSAAHAQTYDDRLLFTNTGQSQWTSGAAAEFNTNGSRFVGIPGEHVGDSIGRIFEKCILGACARFGAKIGLEGDVRAGLNYDVLISNGSLSITLPQHVSFTVPDALAIKQGGTFNIKTTLVPTTTFLIYPDHLSATGHIGNTVIKPSLATTGPTAQALIGLDLNAHFQAIAQVCVVLCQGPNIEEGIARSQEILALNHNGDRQLRVLGEPVVSATTTHSFDDGTIVVSAQLPTLNSDSRRRAAGFDLPTGNLNSGNRANVVTLTARLDKIVSDLLGLPPLNGKAGGFGYNILTADAGLNIDVKQEFTFDPDLRGTLNFTSSVIVGNGGVFNPATATRSVDFRVGDTLSLRSYGALNLGVAPVYRLDNATNNRTGLQVDGNVNVSALGVNGFGVTVGPLLQKDTDGGIGYLSLADNTFRVNTPEIRTSPFNIAFAAQHDSVSADFSCLLALVENCDRQGLISFNPTVCADFFAECAEGARDTGDEIYQIGNLYDLLDTSPDGNDCVRFDAGGRPCNNRFAFEQLIPELLARGDTLRLGTTSGRAFDDNGDRIYLSDTLAAVLGNTRELLVTNDTDEGSARRLAAQGFTNQLPAFSIPLGAPFPVSEPANLFLLLLGVAGLVVLRRTQHAGPASARRSIALAA